MISSVMGTFLSGLFIAGLLFLVGFRLKNARRSSAALQYISGVYVILLFSMMSDSVLKSVSLHSMAVYDASVYGIELATRTDFPSLIVVCYKFVGKFVDIFRFFYEYIVQITFFAAACELFYQKTSLKDNLLTRFMFGSLLSIVLYSIVPVLGGCWFFAGKFPSDMPHSLEAYASPILFADGGSIPRNAMPSMHAAWAILCMLALRRSPLWLQMAGVAYVLVILIATLGSGLHYLLDWIVAVPLVVFIRACLSGIRMKGVRGQALGLSSAALVAWITIIRHADWFIRIPAFLDTMIIFSVVGMMLLEWRLYKSETTEE